MNDYAITHPVDRAVMNAQATLSEWHRQHQAVMAEYLKPGRKHEDVIACMADQILSLRQQLKVLLIEQP